jgi:hypothetical protein
MTPNPKKRAVPIAVWNRVLKLRRLSIREDFKE